MSTPNCRIVFISIVGEKNETLFNRSFGDVNESEMQFSAYASLDIIQEQVDQQITGNYSTNDPFLGFISPTLVGLDFYKIYAYAAATCFKIIAIIDDNEVPATKIRELFEDIHELYSSSMCNPVLVNKLDTPKFSTGLERLVENFA